MVDILRCLVPDSTTPTPNWPERLDGYDYAPAYWAATRARRTQWMARHHQSLDLRAKPTGSLIHSGATGEGTAEWAHCAEAEFWAHFAWSKGLGRYVQTDSLRSRAPHGGALNAYAFGVETPHHPGQDGSHRAATVELVRRLVELGAQWITGHKFVDANKHDPGAVVTSDWWDGLGLEVYWEWIGAGELLRAVRG